MVCKHTPLHLWLWVLLAASPSILWAQGIYTCVDARGRKLISDRPIPECLDRVQKELGSSGVVKRQIAPTTHQNANDEATPARTPVDAGKDRALREARQHMALLDRYGSEAAHNEERKRALTTIDQSIAQTRQALNERMANVKSLNQEAAAYRGKSAPLPRALQLRIDENDQSIELLRGVLDERNAERKRTNERFDEELTVLRKLWAQGGIKP